MVDYFKKKEEIGYNRLVIFEELHSLLSNCEDAQAKETILKIMPVIKRKFASIFSIDSNFTFEELIFKIKNFDKGCNTIFKRIENLDKKKEDFILKNAKDKKNKNFFSQLKNISKETELENERYNSCRELAKILEDTKIQDKTINFCSYLSKLMFSEQKLSRDKLKKIIFDFLWIINQMNCPNPNEKEIKPFLGSLKKPFKKIKGKLIELLGLSEETNNELQTDNLPELITEVETAIKDNDFFTADHTYRKILNSYKQSPISLRKSTYGRLFDIWFRLYFFNHDNF